MKKFCLFSTAIVALLSSQAAAEATWDEGVLVLTDSNFDEELAKYDHLLVEFYAPWCGHCKQLAPEYVKAAEVLKAHDPSYFVAKVDATENDEIAQRFGIKGFPTLFFFKNGQKMEFNGGRTEPAISDWVLRKVGPSHSASDCNGIKEAGANNKFTLVYWGANEGENFASFEAASNGELGEKFTFITSDCEDCAKEHGAAFPGLTIFRQFDEKVLHSSDFDKDASSKWLNAATIPILQEFSEDSIDGIFGERKQAIILFRKVGSVDDIEAIFKQAANDLKGEIVFVTSDVEEGIQGRLGEFVGVTGDILPTIRILDPADGMKKYEFEGKIAEVTGEALKAFITNFKGGNLTPFLKSEPVPEVHEGVQVVVGKNFQEVVVNSEDDILMKFYAPWCGHCKALAPVWEEVAEELKNVKGLKIAKFDATMNEADGVEIQGYPTLKFYKNGKKSAPQAYEGGRTKEEIIEWLKEHSEAFKAHSKEHDEL